MGTAGPYFVLIYVKTFKGPVTIPRSPRLKNIIINHHQSKNELLMRKLFLLFAPMLCMLLPTNNYANPTDALGSISGTVVENELQQPVAYAAVVIKSADGTKTITGGITGEDGKFEIDKLEDG